MKNKISFQVVPGITAASGIASYSGIPLTHRDHAQSCLFLTGHLKDGVIDFDWSKLIIENQTLVIYMGLLSLNELVTNLMRHGMMKKMPIAVIESGTTSKQRVITGVLSNIKSKVSSHYFIKKNGEILTLVPDLYVSWHAGISNWKRYKSINK